MGKILQQSDLAFTAFKMGIEYTNQFEILIQGRAPLFNVPAVLDWIDNRH